MIQITRNLYYYTKQGTLRYSEDSPPRERCEHHICNCTKQTTQKQLYPADQSQQYVEYIKNDKNYKYEVRLDSEGLKFTLRWSGVVKSGYGDVSKNHAYYWFNSNGVNNMIQIEISKQGYGSVATFFAHLYLGNQVDTGKFFNGHSNSRIVDLTKLKSDEVWAHECGFAREVQCSMRECTETAEWRTVFALQKTIQENARTYDKDFESSVETIREKVENDRLMLAKADTLCTWFSWVTRNLDKTELFRVGDYCYINSHEKISEKY